MELQITITQSFAIRDKSSLGPKLKLLQAHMGITCVNLIHLTLNYIHGDQNRILIRKHCSLTTNSPTTGKLRFLADFRQRPCANKHGERNLGLLVCSPCLMFKMDSQISKYPMPQQKAASLQAEQFCRL